VRGFCALALAASLGCSFINVRPASTTEPVNESGVPSCTASEDSPKADAAIATIASFVLVVTAFMAADPCSPSHGVVPQDCSQQTDSRYLLLFAVPTSVAFWASAGYGYHKTGECQELRRASLR
jgi:hypothetical protein